MRYNLLFLGHPDKPMRNVNPIGPYKDCVSALSPDDWQRTIKLGVRTDTFQQYAGRGLATVIAQYYGIVQTGLPSAQHAFKGLNRKLLDEEDVPKGKSLFTVGVRWLTTFGRAHPVMGCPLGLYLPR